MPHPQTLQRKIHGLDCVEEVSMLKRELVPLLGGDERLSFDLLNAKLTIDLTGSSTSQTEIQAAIDRTGLRSEPWNDSGDRDDANTDIPWYHRRDVLTIASGVLGLLGLICQTQNIASPLDKAFYVIGILAGLILVLPKAWRSARTLRPDMNLLMTIAVIGAILIDEWFEAATVAFLFSLSLLLESWSVSRARNAIGSLMDLTPPLARQLLPDGQTAEVDPASISIESVLQVRPGERIPLDGTVTSGISEIDQSPITGESVPVSKQVGDPVFAGTINGSGLLEITTTRPAGDTTLARIIRMVGDASAKRAPSEAWVEKFAAVYTPCVFILAAAIAIVAPLFFNQPWSDWLYRALVLLVIACPCALVISTPVSIVAALTSAARKGVLVKGGVFIEIPARLTAIALDKTGTLTQGKPSVTEITSDSISEEQLLSLAAAIESHSNHPLARAIITAADQRGISVETADDIEIVQGKGAYARIGGKRYWAGSSRFRDEQPYLANSTIAASSTIDSPISDPTIAPSTTTAQQPADAQTVVYVGDEQTTLGRIRLADPVRDEAHAALAELRDAGIQSIHMLTGDNRKTAESIAKLVGITEIHAELLPEDKVAAVQSLVRQHAAVAMIGDGINDAPALATATLGIAMGTAGSDAAIETADIALMSDDLRLLPWLRRHSQRTLRIIRQNIVFALTIKLIFVALTFFGYASLWAAIAADTGASLLVIFNALRLLRS
ncbi:Cd2+/Zn2+-exporting ATPase [Neorhodopirellula lusitana]|uniref:P-type Zn(2+) transporter n=1 Tax=Neorhodopirellula lusitana TaxID=445327 RepID=A0ABY1PX87_9BACT|nr:cation-translocating P-type ATPase [Neorhodopirellula lusitana]SMP51438.1 Cd2+/Zn2+-exporting ATPase [Neorhodopirellula lusitana]